MLPLTLALVAQSFQLPIVTNVEGYSLQAEREDPHRAWRSTAPDFDTRRKAAADLSRALESAGQGPNGGKESLEALRSAAVVAAASLGAGSQNTARILRAIDASDETMRRQDTQSSLSGLNEELDLVSRDLAFEPLVESPRPAGFPEATVVGEFEVLAYPAYRMARTSMPRSLLGQQNSAFWKLFRHIQSHDIPMTAPVEMTWGPSDATQSEAGRAFENMAFLYVSTEVGRAGTDGDVEVLDVPAATVASVGVRGSSDNQRVRHERERLRTWIAGRPERFEILGPPRMMGWNSPMVADARRYWEVQFPVRILEPKVRSED